MTVYADYTFYTDTYLGTVIATADWTRLELRASEIIDRLTFQRAADDEDNTVAIQNATCAVADVFYTIEQGGGADGIKSEGIGANRVSYSDGSSMAMTKEDQYEAAALRYLGSTFLMFKGFNSDEI